MNFLKTINSFRSSFYKGTALKLLKEGRIDQAIEYFHYGLELITKNDHAENWLDLHANLGIAHISRASLGGTNPSHLDINDAIKHFELILAQPELEKIPFFKVDMLNSLGEALRLNGAIEQSIVNYELAIQLLLQIDSIDKIRMFADTYENLGLAYTQRLEGVRSENIETAILYLKKSEETFSSLNDVHALAKIGKHLGSTYAARIIGEHTENLEWALSYYQDAFKYENIEPDKGPNEIELFVSHLKAEGSRLIGKPAPVLDNLKNWIQTYYNLGIIYSQRIAGRKEDNLEKAVEYQQSAINKLENNNVSFPTEWLQAHLSIANSYLSRIKGNRSDNLQRTLHYCDILISTSKNAWITASAKRAKSLALEQLSKLLNQGTQLEQAINLDLEALAYFEEEQFLFDAAETHNHLAMLYKQRNGKGTPRDFALAIDQYEAAFEIYTQGVYPEGARNILTNLGNFYFEDKKWLDSLNVYQKAIEAGEAIFSAAQTDLGKRVEVGQLSTPLFHRAYALIRLKRLGDALLELEQGKARLLRESLMSQDLDGRLLPNSQYRSRLLAGRKEVRQLEIERRQPPGTPSRRSDQELFELLRQARTKLSHIHTEIFSAFPDLEPTKFSTSELLQSVPENTVLIPIFFTSMGGIAFLIPFGTTTLQEQNVVSLTSTNEHVMDLAAIWSQKLSSAQQANTDLFGEFDNWTQQLWELIVGPIHQRLEKFGMEHVVFIPQGGLQVMPLHVAWRNVDGERRYFMDDYKQVSFSPSIHSLNVARKWTTKLQGNNALLAGVSKYGEALPNLPNIPSEMKRLEVLLNTKALLDEDVNPGVIYQLAPSARYLHIACHGGFAQNDDPLKSALFLGNDTFLTLADVLGKLELHSTRLVVLSACETGLIELNHAPNEHIGFTIGFMQAGCPGVISSLWQVRDDSTVLLMQRLYENILHKSYLPGTALREAQRWLSTLTEETISTLKGEVVKSVDTSSDSDLDRFFESVADSKWRPYEHPYYWSAFIFTGV